MKLTVTMPPTKGDVEYGGLRRIFRAAEAHRSEEWDRQHRRHGRRIHGATHTHMATHARTFTRTHAYSYPHTHTHTHTHAHTDRHRHMHTHTHKHTHTNTHTHTHTHIGVEFIHCGLGCYRNLCLSLRYAPAHSPPSTSHATSTGVDTCAALVLGHMTSWPNFLSWSCRDYGDESAGFEGDLVPGWF
jgi:hypothetical protein